MLDMEKLIQRDGSLYKLAPYIFWDADSRIVLDGDFDPEELQQIADYVRTKEGGE